MNQKRGTLWLFYIIKLINKNSIVYNKSNLFFRITLDQVLEHTFFNSLAPHHIIPTNNNLAVVEPKPEEPNIFWNIQAIRGFDLWNVQIDTQSVNVTVVRLAKKYLCFSRLIKIYIFFAIQKYEPVTILYSPMLLLTRDKKWQTIISGYLYQKLSLFQNKTIIAMKFFILYFEKII